MRSRTIRKLLGALAAAVLAVAMIAPAAQADTPNPGFEGFAGCPSSSENPKSELCTRTVITGGSFKMGNKDVPITKPITIVAGSDVEFNGFYTNSKGGMSKTAQTVPGGVVGLTGLTWLLEHFGVNALSLHATTELAGQPDLNPFAEPIEIPIKVHLTSPSGVLGKNCYVGSNSNPIMLNLTTGTTSPPPPNKPISGTPPELKFQPNGTILFDNGTFVDNSFAAPGASGCVLTLFGFIPVSINSLVNFQSGLPSAAGNNSTTQHFDIEAAEETLVYP